MVLFDRAQNSDDVGAQLDYAHEGIGCKPSYIGSHTVDCDSNIGEFVDSLK